MAISVAALAGFAGMPDHRACNGSSGTANDRAFHRITGYGCTNCRSA
ncbi:hypothetical protein HNQ71_004184 [Mesorhizobium sangaii]|uniref:Uncharacterized protein n=1 Tax=Mesorhizobium sangaii TaxID=505389 RepID=A0A841P8M1_9HYPH|nr:hypothetical protein [Mesorhizobium sangaii]